MWNATSAGVSECPADGYDVGQAQHIRIGIGLPLNAADGGMDGIQGDWNGTIQNLGGGGLIGTVGSTTSATDGGYVGSSTDGGHTIAEIGAVGNFGVIQSTHQLDLGMINDYIYEAEHQQVEWAKKLRRDLSWHGAGAQFLERLLDRRSPGSRAR